MQRRDIVASLSGVIVLSVIIPATAAVMQEGAKEVKVKSSQLPAVVAQSIKNDCPKCVIDKASREVENGVTIFDIEFRRGQGEMDLAADGFIIERETVVPASEVPAAALEAIRKAGGKIRQIAKDEVRAELKDGNVIKLDMPKYLYEADLVKGNQVAEIQVSADGQVVEAPKWRTRGTPEN
jgi:hypothetical protein